MTSLCAALAFSAFAILVSCAGDGSKPAAPGAGGAGQSGGGQPGGGNFGTGGGGGSGPICDWQDQASYPCSATASGFACGFPNRGGRPVLAHAPEALFVATGQALYRVDKASPGAVTAVISGTGEGVTNVLVDGASVYFTSLTGVGRVSIDATAASGFVNQCSFGARGPLAVDATAIYWLASPFQGIIASAAKNGAPTTTLGLQFQGAPQGLAADDTRLYVAFDFGLMTGLKHARCSCTCSQNDAGRAAAPSALGGGSGGGGAGGGFVGGGGTGGTDPGAGITCKTADGVGLAGGSGGSSGYYEDCARQLAPLNPDYEVIEEIRQMEVDATHVYWVEGEALKRMRKDGTALATVLASEIWSFVLDGDHIVAYRGKHGSAEARDIVRLAKDGSGLAVLEARPAGEYPIANLTTDGRYGYFVTTPDSCTFDIHP